MHPVARAGFAVAAEAYERGRPGYPLEALAWLVEQLRLGPGSQLADVGAGTGKLTAQLVGLGLRPLAVEPVAAMRARLHERLPEVEVVDGSAERLPLADASLDAAVAGQAFHWFRGEEALAELSRVLRPGGGVGLIWNRRDESVGWVARLSELLAPYRGDVPRYASGRWRQAFEASQAFGPLEEEHFSHAHELSPDGLLDWVSSLSIVAALPRRAREEVLRDVAALVATEPALAGRRLLQLPYRTDVYLCRRLPG